MHVKTRPYVNMFVLQALLSSQSQLKEVEMENSRLQMHLKELNEEYRARLMRYLQDLSVSPCPVPHDIRTYTNHLKHLTNAKGYTVTCFG